VCKSTTYYAGDSVAEDLHSNMEVRNARYCRPGPASTGIPVVSLGLAASRVSIALYGTSNHPVA
jgi:hypothetical protein